MIEQKLSGRYWAPLRWAACAALAGLAPCLSAQDAYRTTRVLALHKEGAWPDQVIGCFDLEGDGDVDLAALETTPTDGPDLAYTLVNDGAGGFSQIPTAIDAPQAIRATAVGDVTGDGVVDLVIAQRFSSFFGNRISVLAGVGDGTFEPAIQLDPGEEPIDVQLADFSGDGIADIGILGKGTSFGARVFVLTYNGLGFDLLGPKVSLGSAAVAIEGVELDGDGYADFVIKTSPVGPAVVHGGPQGLGSVQMYGENEGAQGLGDVDGDGDADLVVVRELGAGGFRIRRWINEGGVLTLESAAGTKVDAPGPIADVGDRARAADWDGDGDLDWFIQDWLFETTGPGEFAPATYFQGGIDLGVLDVDGDGHLDTVSEKGYRVGASKFAGDPPASEFDIPPYNTFRPVDWDGDGDVDLLSLVGLQPQVARVFENNGAGAFVEGAVALDAPSTIYPIAFADFTGDGIADFLSSPSLGPNSVLSQGLPGGTFATAIPATVEGVFWELSHRPSEVVDLDGDGDLDVIVTEYEINVFGGHSDTTTAFWINDGAGFFDRQVLWNLTEGVFETGDMDGDGDLDFLTRTGTFPYGLRVRRNDGPLTYKVVSVPIAEVHVGTGDWADLDSDGDLDVVAGLSAGAPSPLTEFKFAVSENLGGVSFAPQVLHSGAGFSGTRIQVTDVDLDGAPDLTMLVDQSEAIAVYRNVGDGSAFDAPRFWAHPGPVWLFTNDAPVDQMVDVDSNGTLDALGSQADGLSRFVLSGGHTPATGGVIEQYGEGSVGTGSIAPLLGAQGAVAKDSLSAELRIRRGLGDTVGWLLFGTTRVDIADVPFPGSSLYVLDFFTPFPFQLDGTPGAAAEGTFDLPLAIGPAQVGLTLFHQAFLIDPGAPFGVSSSNGLQITYGTGL